MIAVRAPARSPGSEPGEIGATPPGAPGGDSVPDFRPQRGRDRATGRLKGPDGKPIDRRRGDLPGSEGGADSVIDRRTGLDRRAMERLDSGGQTGLERRRGPGRRLSDSLRAAEEGEMTKEQFLFLMAIDSFKQVNQVQFPTWTDVLEVVRLLGYRKTMPSEVFLPCAEDWRETPSAPANVRPDKFERRVAEALGQGDGFEDFEADDEREAA